MTVLRSGSASHVGQVRTSNQDMTLETEILFAVADGMGGHVGGEIAAQVAVESLRTAFTRQPTIEGLRKAVEIANRAVWKESQSQESLRGMGTTLTACGLVAGADGRDVLALVNVGDSRAYVYSDQHITQVTNDHSVAEEKVRQGELTEAEAAIHPQRHILTRALGISPEVDIDMWEVRVRTGDRVLLCSDGLTNEVGINLLSEVLGAVSDPEQAAHVLIESANKHGGNDNITVVIVDVLAGEESGIGATTVESIGDTQGPPLLLSTTTGNDESGESNQTADDAGATSDADGHSAASGGGQISQPERNDQTTNPSFATKEDIADPLAPGVQLGITGVIPALGSSGIDSNDLFLGGNKTRRPSADNSLPRPASGPTSGPTSGPMPVSTRNTVAYTPPPPLSVDQASAKEKPRKERRGARRRRLGIPRRITFRVLLFFILLAAVPVGAYYAIKWYANDNWYVTIQGSQVVILQGRPGGLIWFKPKIVEATGVPSTDVLPDQLANLQNDVEEPSLSAARTYVNNLVTESSFAHGGALSTAPTTTTTTTLTPKTTSTTSTTSTTKNGQKSTNSATTSFTTGLGELPGMKSTQLAAQPATQLATQLAAQPAVPGAVTKSQPNYSLPIPRLALAMNGTGLKGDY